MRNMYVENITEQGWFSDETRELVNKFSNYAKEHKGSRLILSLYSEPESEEELEVMLENGYYDFKYPENNPYSKELEQMVNEAENCARFLSFDPSDLW